MSVRVHNPRILARSTTAVNKNPAAIIIASGAREAYSYWAMGRRAIVSAAMRPTGSTFNDQAMTASAAAAFAKRPSNINTSGEAPNNRPIATPNVCGMYSIGE